MKAKGTGCTREASHPFLEFQIFLRFFFEKNNKKILNHGEKDAEALLFLVILRHFCLRFPGRASPFPPANSVNSLPARKKTSLTERTENAGNVKEAKSGK
ncbi:MAG: hypothetical protein IJW05_02110 [Lentisphaeria bacterium]|nr:hypothetical protein [Lentisphaeria bacterium]